MNKIAVVLLTVFTTCFAVDLGIGWDADGVVTISAIDDDGRLYHLDPSADSETWSIEEGSPCPGEGPYRLSIVPTLGGIRHLILDNTGQLFMFAESSWEDLGEPLEGKAPFLLAVNTPSSPEMVQIMALTGDGESALFELSENVWHRFTELLRWDPSLGYIVTQDEFPGKTPDDFSLVSMASISYLFAVDHGGTVYVKPGMSGWERTDNLADGVPPFTICSWVFADGSGGVYEVVDGEGKYFADAPGAEEGLALLEGVCPGEPPFDLGMIAITDGPGPYYIICLDAEGALYNYAEGEWTRQLRGF